MKYPVTSEVKQCLLDLSKRRIWIEGNIIKVLDPENDKEFAAYLREARERDDANRKKRLDITKQIQKQNQDLKSKDEENLRLMEELKEALTEVEGAKDKALADLDLVQKKSQFELIGQIVRVALWVILGVGGLSTVMYIGALWLDKDTQIIGSTWSNLLGILLTNAFSIVGPIMGVKYASENKQNDKL
jgi:hypothetical protein